MSGCGSQEETEFSAAPEPPAGSATPSPQASPYQETSSPSAPVVAAGPIAAEYGQTFTDFRGFVTDVVYKVHETRLTTSPSDSTFCGTQLEELAGANARFKVTTVEVDVTPRPAEGFTRPEGAVLPTSVNLATYGTGRAYRIACGDGSSPSTVSAQSISPPISEVPSQFAFDIVTGTTASPSDPDGAFDAIDPAILIVGSSSSGGDSGVDGDLCAVSGGEYSLTGQTCTYGIE